MSLLWVIGARGQLGFFLAEQLAGSGHGFDRADLDLGQTTEIQSRLNTLAKSFPPTAVINATAYNQVDKAESDQGACTALNVDAPRELALWCREANVPFLHFSTDFVYSGAGDKPWLESDPTEPVNFYGVSKLRGEHAVLEANPQAGIVRTSWVYSHRRENFVLAILKRARLQSELTVVNDQIGSPTHADALAKGALLLLDHPDYFTARDRVWHLSDAGYVSRFEFAREILRQAATFEPELAKVTVHPVVTAELTSAARRPLNTKLSLERAHKFGIIPPDWKQSLKHCLERLYERR